MKGEIQMTNVIDVHDLPEEDVMIVQEIVDKLREKRKNQDSGERDGVEFGRWPLGVKGNLSRSEIYEDR
jgi:hypothetical protein